MSDLSKDPVSLNDLKRDIEEFEYCSQRYTKHDGTYQTALADAWRTAFDWLNGWTIRTGNPSAAGARLLLEHTEGMALIRSKLT